MKGCLWVQASLWISQISLLQELWWICIQLSHLWNNVSSEQSWPLHDVESDGNLCWCALFNHGIWDPWPTWLQKYCQLKEEWNQLVHLKIFKYLSKPQNLLCVVESTGTDCLHDLQEIAFDPILMRWHEVDTPFSLSPSKSESKYPSSLKSSTLEYLSLISWVPFKYLRTLYATFQCPSQGFC